MTQSTNTKWWVLGGSGLTGHALIKTALQNNDTVLAWVRRKGSTLLEHSQLTEAVVDLTQPSQWPGIQADVAVSCLGTTIRTAGSKEAFKSVDMDLVVHMAQHAKAHGVRHFMVISALGANSQSPIFYNRVKGQMQDALQAIGFERLTILQPSLLDGDRSEFRLGEQMGLVAMRLFKPLTPKNYQAIHADTIARAISVLAKSSATGVQIVSSAQLQELGAFKGT